MPNKIKFPSEEELKKMRDLLSKGPASKPLPKNAGPVDKTKHQICREFVVYINTKKMTQKALAEKIGIDVALMSKILHYNVEEFTIDRLMKFLNMLYPHIEITIDVA
jgi:predicted XRE-type DNA-binding protein